MTGGEWEQLTIGPLDMRQGDIILYLIKDYLKPPGSPLISQGEWEVIDSEGVRVNHIAVDDEGWAYDVAAVSYHCRSVASDKYEWKLFTPDRKVTVRRRNGAV